MLTGPFVLRHAWRYVKIRSSKYWQEDSLELQRLSGVADGEEEGWEKRKKTRATEMGTMHTPKMVP